MMCSFLTLTIDALVYYIDPDCEEMKIAYPTMLFDHNIIDGRGMMCSFLTLTIGNNQGMGDVEYGKIYDFYFPPPFLRKFDGPNRSIVDMWRTLGRQLVDGGLVTGTIIKPKLGLQPKPFGEACYAFWQGGDFIKNDEPQGNQAFCQMHECIPEVVKAMRACIKETGEQKLFSANITADDPAEMIARQVRSGTIRPTCGELRTPGGRLRGGWHWDHYMPPELPRSVLALPSCRTRRSDEPADAARVHCFRAHEDVPHPGCERHPCRHHELR